MHILKAEHMQRLKLKLNNVQRKIDVSSFLRYQFLFIIYIIVLLLLFSENISAASKVSVSIKAKHAIIMDADTGKVIYKKNAYGKCHNASTTKLMTAIVALENNKKLNKKIKISKNAARFDSQFASINSKSGERYYFKDLLNAMLISSACDCAVAVAEGTSGSESRFVKKMNKKAKEIGCKHTKFSNASGVWSEKKHYTTAYDLALITQYAYSKKTIRKILTKRSYSFKSVSGKICYVETTNELLKSKKYRCIGKTGTGKTAKYCFAGVYNYKSHTYIIDVLGSGSEAERWSDVKKLIDTCRSYTND